MKRLLKIAVLLLLCCGFSACDKDEPPTSGLLEITFSTKVEVPSYIEISTEAGNQIHQLNAPGGKARIQLNAGNYKVWPTSSGTSYRSCFVQVVLGKKTKVHYASENAFISLE